MAPITRPRAGFRFRARRFLEALAFGLYAQGTMHAAGILATVLCTINPVIALGIGRALRPGPADSRLYVAEFRSTGVLVIRTAILSRPAIRDASENRIAAMAWRTNVRPVLAASIDTEIVGAGIPVVARRAVGTADRLDDNAAGCVSGSFTVAAACCLVGRPNRGPIGANGA